MNSHKLFSFLLSFFHPWHSNLLFVTFFIQAFLMCLDSCLSVIRCGDFLRDTAWFAHKFVYLLTCSFYPFRWWLQNKDVLCMFICKSCENNMLQKHSSKFFSQFNNFLPSNVLPPIFWFFFQFDKKKKMKRYSEMNISFFWGGGGSYLQHLCFSH